jgi:ring-1,2-phenylacetyl-CoA epoxidase subunit PaaD
MPVGPVRVGGATAGGVVSAADVVATVTDPELPMVTLAELGIVREVRETVDGVLVAITPTYSGCPAMEAIRDDIVRALRDAGFGRAVVRTQLSPAWTTDWISESGKAKLAAAGISPPGPAPRRTAGPVPLVLGLRGEAVRGEAVRGEAVRGEAARGEAVRGEAARGGTVVCPLCGCAETERISAFGATACRELRRCPACREPFEHMKEI